MAIRADLSRISFLGTKGVRIIDASLQTVIDLDPGDVEGETRVTLTPAQKQTILARLGSVVAELQQLTAGLQLPGG